MPKPNKQTIIDLLIKEIEQGKERGKLLAIFSKKWQLSQRTFDRYWKVANEQHVVRQQAIKTELDKQDIELAKDARKRAIMSVIERKEYLTKIVNGEILIKKPIVTKDGIKNVPFEPDHTERLRALAELNKMDGDYAPGRQKIEVETPNAINITRTVITKKI